MAIDAGIYQNFLRPPKTVQEYDNEAMQAQDNALSLQAKRMQMGELQRKQADDDLFRNTARGFGPDSSANYNALLKAGLVPQAQAYQKSVAEARDKTADADKKQSEIIDARLRQSASLLSNVRTPEQYLAWHEGNHSDPVLGPLLASRGITADQARKNIMEELQKPGGFEQLIQKSALGLDAFYNKIQEDARIAETGRHNLSTERTAQGQLGVAQGNLGVARERLKFDKEQPKGQIVQTDNGPVLVDPRTGDGRVVNGPDGQPLTGLTKPLNDSQSKALLFGSRAREANKVLAELEKSGTSASVPGSRAPIIGGVIGALQGGNQQSLDQAKRDFMTAVLRRESGASIAPSEFDTADKQYFPQIGDSAQVKAQKARNRQLVIDGILTEVPEKQRGTLSSPQVQPASGAPKIGTVEDGHRFKGGNPADPKNWEKVK